MVREDKEVFILTIYGDVDNLVLDELGELWVDKTGKLGICCNNLLGDIPDLTDYPWVKVSYNMKDFGKSIETFNWVKKNLKASLIWAY